MLVTELDNRGLARVILDRPEKHNAFDAAMIASLTATFKALGADPQVRAVLLAGNGPSFCAGADAGWMRDSADLSVSENRADALHLSDMLWTIDRCPKPVIAIAHGNIFGGGVGLVACADMVICRSDARFRLSEVRLGLIPATIAPFVMWKMCPSAARRYFITAEDFGPEEAQSMRLVHIVSDTPEEQVDRWHEAILLGAPGAIAEAKALVRDVTGRPINATLRARTADRIADRRASAEGQEGLKAFIERRKPAWVPE